MSNDPRQPSDHTFAEFQVPHNLKTNNSALIEHDAPHKHQSKLKDNTPQIKEENTDYQSNN